MNESIVSAITSESRTGSPVHSHETPAAQPAKEPLTRGDEARVKAVSLERTQMTERACLDCGEACKEQEFFCGPCGSRREEEGVDYLDQFVAGLAKARRLKNAHEYARSLAVLQSLSNSELKPEDAAIVRRRIERVRDARTSELKKRRAKHERMRELIEGGQCDEAMQILKKIPRNLRNGDSKKLAGNAKGKAQEIRQVYQCITQALKERRHETLLPAINRFLAIAPKHVKAPKIEELRREYLLRKARVQLKKRNHAKAAVVLESTPVQERDILVGDLRGKTRCSVDVPTGPHSQTMIEPPIVRQERPRQHAHANFAVSRQVSKEVDQTEDALDLIRNFNRKCLRSGWTPWLLAVYCQVLILVLLYSLALSAEEFLKTGVDQIELSAVFADPGPPGIETIIPQQIEPEEVKEPSAEESPDVVEEATKDEPLDEESPVDSADIESLEETIQVDVAADESPMTESDTAAEEEAQAASPGNDEPLEIPPAPSVAERAVSSGNFLVWVEPAVPFAGEPYCVYVQIRLPERVKRYSRTDLTGVLIGSDGYRKSISGPEREDIPLIANTATIVIHVVGAARPEADTLVIRSRLLRQQKTIRLVYGRI